MDDVRPGGSEPGDLAVLADVERRLAGLHEAARAEAEDLVAEARRRAEGAIAAALRGLDERLHELEARIEEEAASERATIEADARDQALAFERAASERLDDLARAVVAALVARLGTEGAP